MTPLKMNKIMKVLLLVAAVLILGAVYLGNKKLSSVAEQTAQLKAEAAVAEQQVATYEETKATVDSLEYVNELASKVLPPDKEQSAIIAEISEFALRSSLTISQITFDEAQGGSADKKLTIPQGVQVVPITVQFAEGSNYTAILDFLKTTETNQRKMQVTDISITPDAENRQLFNEASVSMNLYAKQDSGARNE